MIRKIIKIFIFSLAVFAFSAANASAAISCRVAASCSGSEVSILELTDTTNAHAGFPGSGYPYAVCCSGANGLSTSCSGGQVVVKLSGSSNAHARLNSELDYPGSNNACMSVSSGTLTLVNQDNDCAGFDTTILSLVKVPTNSHVGEGNMYPHKVCAKYRAPTTGGGGWIPNFGFGSGSITPAPVANVPSVLTVSIPTFTFHAPVSNQVAQASEPLSTSDDQVFESVEPLTVTEEMPADNLQPAAVSQNRSGLATLITSTPFKAVSIILILALIFISRRLYLKGK